VAFFFFYTVWKLAKKVRYTPHSKAKIRLVQHYSAAILSLAELLFTAVPFTHCDQLSRSRSAFYMADYRILSLANCRSPAGARG